MLTSTSPSPSSSGCAQSPPYKARAYHSSPRSFASTPASASYRLTATHSPRSQAASVPKSTLVADAIPSRPTTVDAGTQYSPPDWPPTDPRSSLNGQRLSTDPVGPAPATHSARPAPEQDTSGSSSQQPAGAAANARASLAEQPPTEPQLRITPQESLQNASRRPHSDDSSVDPSPQSASASKRARHAANSKRFKVMPADYVTCEPKILAAVIAEMLMRLIHHNDTIPLKDGQLTRFHSRAPPGISVHDYLQRLTFHATLSPPILLSMVFFIDRLSSNFPTFIINSLTVHRFLITAATVASKGLSDSFWTNQTYARVGGVSVKELALLELELLMKCDWKIVPGPEQLVEYYQGLVEQSEDWVLEGFENDAPSRGDDDNNLKAILPNGVRERDEDVQMEKDDPGDKMDTAESNA